MQDEMVAFLGQNYDISQNGRNPIHEVDNQ